MLASLCEPATEICPLRLAQAQELGVIHQSGFGANARRSVSIAVGPGSIPAKNSGCCRRNASSNRCERCSTRAGSISAARSRSDSTTPISEGPHPSGKAPQDHRRPLGIVYDQSPGQTIPKAAAQRIERNQRDADGQNPPNARGFESEGFPPRACLLPESRREGG